MRRLVAGSLLAVKLGYRVAPRTPLVSGGLLTAAAVIALTVLAGRLGLGRLLDLGRHGADVVQSPAGPLAGVGGGQGGRQRGVAAHRALGRTERAGAGLAEQGGEVVGVQLDTDVGAEQS